uniref:Mediator of RNA polymerase II transcription subunit 21 n=1 Tax=Caenorhabditis tropicalis TaxID=1561998 RepID=A0A1I7TBL5_9PELO
MNAHWTLFTQLTQAADCTLFEKFGMDMYVVKALIRATASADIIFADQGFDGLPGEHRAYFASMMFRMTEGLNKAINSADRIMQNIHVEIEEQEAFPRNEIDEERCEYLFQEARRIENRRRDLFAAIQINPRPELRAEILQLRDEKMQAEKEVKEFLRSMVMMLKPVRDDMVRIVNEERRRNRENIQLE